MQLINKESIVRKQRLAKGLTAYELGIEIGIPEKSARSNIQMLEAGKSCFSLKRARKLADVLGIKIENIISECE